MKPNAGKRHPFRVGDVVRLVPDYAEGIHPRLAQIAAAQGGLLEVKGWGWFSDGRGYITPKGSFGLWYVERFKLVEREAIMKKIGFVKLLKFDVDDIGGPGWNPLMEPMIGGVYKPEALDEKSHYKDKPWMIVEGYYWPLEAMEPIDDPKDLKKAIAAHKKAVKKAAVKKEKKLSLRATLRKQVGSNPGVCSYGIETDGGRYIMHVRDVCHARLTSNGSAKAVALHVNEHFKKADEEVKDTYKTFMNYLFNRSPYAMAFKTKRASEALTREVMMNVDATASQLCTGAVALRMASEYKGFLPAFKRVRELGGSEHAAFFIANTHLYLNGKWTRHWTGGHQIMNRQLSYSSIIRCFKEGANKVNEGPFKTRSERYKIFATLDPKAVGWGDPGHGMDSVDNVFTKASPAKLLGGGWDAAQILGDESMKGLIAKIDADIKALFVK